MFDLVTRLLVVVHMHLAITSSSKYLIFCTMYLVDVLRLILLRFRRIRRGTSTRYIVQNKRYLEDEVMARCMCTTTRSLVTRLNM